jgi:hypothetical protein
MTHQRTAGVGPGFWPPTGDILREGNTAILKEIDELSDLRIDELRGATNSSMNANS